MARIAREAGISKALLYHYFPSKHAYFVAALEQAADEVRRRTEPDPSLPPDQALATSLDAFLGWLEENATAYHSESRAVPEVGALIDRCATRRPSGSSSDWDWSRARRRRPAPPSQAGCGSWTAWCSIGSSNAICLARRSPGCCSKRSPAR